MAQNDAYLDSMIRVPIKNVYAGTIPAYSIMAVTDASRVNGIRYSHVTKPSTTWYWRYLMNGPTPILQSQTGYGFFGCVPAKYLTGTPANGEIWGAKPGQWEIEKGYPGGFMIDGVENSTNKIAFGVLAPWIAQVYGKVGSAVTKDTTSASVAVYYGAPTSGATATGQTITGVHCPWDAIASGKWVGVTRDFNGYPTLNAREC